MEITKKDRDERTKRIEKRVLTKFNIPPKFIDASFETFKGKEKLVRECSEYTGGGLVLRGSTGVGKTHLSVSILRKLIEADKMPDDCFSWDVWKERRIQGADSISIPTLLADIRDSFNDNIEETKTEKQIIDHYSQVPFLILDDLGSEKATEFAITTLYIIINHRDDWLMDTIITTNLTQEQIEDALGARIASRMAGMRNVLIKADDYRKRK